MHNVRDREISVNYLEELNFKFAKHVRLKTEDGRKFDKSLREYQPIISNRAYRFSNCIIHFYCIVLPIIESKDQNVYSFLNVFQWSNSQIKSAPKTKNSLKTVATKELSDHSNQHWLRSILIRFWIVLFNLMTIIYIWDGYWLSHSSWHDTNFANKCYGDELRLNKNDSSQDYLISYKLGFRNSPTNIYLALIFLICIYVELPLLAAYYYSITKKLTFNNKVKQIFENSKSFLLDSREISREFFAEINNLRLKCLRLQEGLGSPNKQNSGTKNMKIKRIIRLDGEPKQKKHHKTTRDINHNRGSYSAIDDNYMIAQESFDHLANYVGPCIVNQNNIRLFALGRCVIIIFVTSSAIIAMTVCYMNMLNEEMQLFFQESIGCINQSRDALDNIDNRTYKTITMIASKLRYFNINQTYHNLNFNQKLHVLKVLYTIRCNWQSSLIWTISISMQIYSLFWFTHYWLQLYDGFLLAKIWSNGLFLKLNRAKEALQILRIIESKPTCRMHTTEQDLIERGTMRIPIVKNQKFNINSNFEDDISHDEGDDDMSVCKKILQFESLMLVVCGEFRFFGQSNKYYSDLYQSVSVIYLVGVGGEIILIRTMYVDERYQNAVITLPFMIVLLLLGSIYTMLTGIIVRFHKQLHQGLNDVFGQLSTLKTLSQLPTSEHLFKLHRHLIKCDSDIDEIYSTKLFGSRLDGTYNIGMLTLILAALMRIAYSHM